jgi:drug/metabolite transporter (DMT)-like permease
MSDDKNIFENDFLKANIIPADINLYVVTKDKLTNISTSSIWNDVLIFLASLAWGAFFATVIALKTSDNLSEIKLLTISAYQNIFFWSGIIFFFFFIAMKIYLYWHIRSITKSNIEFKSEEKE